MKNTLFYGDNLEVLRHHIDKESVDLCYIDPPFNSNRDYFQIYNNIGGEDRAQAQAFTDTWTWDTYAIEGYAEIMGNAGGRFSSQTIELLRGLKAVLKEGALMAYLVSMTLRIVEIHRVLKPTGSFYLHCDPTASHYLKLVLDSIFCAEGGDFKNEIIWERTNAHNNVGHRFARIHDVILFYTKSANALWNPQLIGYSPAQLKRYKQDPVDGRLYTGQDLTNTLLSPNSDKQFTWRGTTPPANRGWAYSLEKLEEWWNAGLILLKQDGTPRMDGRKVYLEDKKGKPIGSIWNDIPRIGNTAGERLGYPTQKPEALLERIIQASSNEGDTVLDAYCGCGTSIAVAQRLKRQWIGVDITYQSIGVILKRLNDSFGKEVADSVVLNGIPRDIESARALANKKDDRVRKEFEKWAVLTYSRHNAVINNKKGADAGIDGVQYFPVTFGSDEIGKAVYQVKSGNVGRGDIAKLRGDMARENAYLGVFLTLAEPTAPMKAEASAAGQYFHPLMQRNYPAISIVSVREMLENGARLDLPISHEVNKKASTATSSSQASLDL